MMLFVGEKFSATWHNIINALIINWVKILYLYGLNLLFVIYER